MYRIEITVNIPYPWQLSQTISATGVGTATNRALRLMRKNDRLKGKRISEWSIKIIKL